MHTVGAGGGSIAHVPELTGALRVGPESAGAEPGPAAYGRGGTHPTVTDANVVLGHLPPRLIGGEMALDVEAAHAAVETIAEAMGLSVDQAAEGIVKIVNENMAGALRVISVQRGHDPREFALVAFGGAGPLHANAVAALMGSFPVIVPPVAGAAVRARRPRRRLPQRVRADAHPPHRGRDRRRAGRDPRRARGPRARVDGRAAHRPRAPAGRRSWPTCATQARATRSAWRSTTGRSAPGTSRRSRSASTACTSGSTASACPTRRRRSSTCARSAPASGRTPSCPRASPAMPTRAPR